jgi:hypothetical protein
MLSQHLRAVVPPKQLCPGDQASVTGVLAVLHASAAAAFLARRARMNTEPGLTYVGIAIAEFAENRQASCACSIEVGGGKVIDGLM